MVVDASFHVHEDGHGWLETAMEHLPQGRLALPVLWAACRRSFPESPEGGEHPKMAEPVVEDGEDGG